MKSLKRLLSTLILASGATLLALPAWALNLVHPVSLAQARNGVSITVWDGGGTNIDFTHTNEIIQRVWLDDSSKLTLDVDGNLCSGGSNCSSTGAGAGIIHLRRLLGVHFPNIPSSSSTLLSVVTLTGQGEHNLYEFQIGYAHGSPQYSTVSMRSDTNQIAGDVLTADGRAVDVQAVTRGLQQAISQHLITVNSPVIPRVQDFVAGVSNGTSVADAISQANVSMALVSRLAQMGSPTMLLAPSAIAPGIPAVMPTASSSAAPAIAPEVTPSTVSAAPLPASSSAALSP